MKLSGNKRNGRHLNNSTGRKPQTRHKKGRRRIVLRVFTILTASITAIFLFVVMYWQFGISPPDVSGERRPNHPSNSTNANNPGGAHAAEPPGNPSDADTRQDGKFTFLILGADDEGAFGNTDVIMVAMLNTYDYTLNVVSIPRDTLVNVNWNVRKANSIFPVMMNRESGSIESAMESAVDHFADLLGFEVDFYFVIDMEAFVRLVDAVGGVEFYVPVNMSHPEFAQRYTRGLQHLNGRQAIDIMRFRGFVNADIGRIGTQHSFLTAAVPQIMENVSLGILPELVRIFINYVETDLGFDDLLWFAQQLLRMDAENIHFAMMPGNTTDRINGLSYVTVFVDQWLEMVNERLNPFNEEITAQDVSILTRGSDRRLFVTDGNWRGNASWGQTQSAGGSTPSAGANTSTTPPPSTEDNQPEADEPPNEYDPTDPADIEPPLTEQPELPSEELGEIPPQLPELNPETPPTPEPPPDEYADQAA